MGKSKGYVARRSHRQVPNRRFMVCLIMTSLLPAGWSVAQMPVPDLGHTLTRVDPPLVAPAFTLVDMDGEEHALSDYRGKVIMLNFWATWCPPCRREMPSMEALYKRFQNEGFIVLAVNQWEDGDIVFPYIGQLSVFPSFPILFDREGGIAQAYRVKGLPTTVLINRQGQVVYRAVGGRDFDHPEVRGIIRELVQ